MKSEKSNTWVQFRVYDKPEAQQLIEKVKHQLCQSAQEAGRRDAESDLPGKRDKLRLFVGHLLSQIQQLINDLRSLHKADEDLTRAVAKQEKLLQQERHVRDDIQTRQVEVEKEYQKYKDSFPSVMAIIISVIILLLGLMEGLISLEAIRAFVPHYLMALFTALVYGLSLTILAHQVLRWWNMGTKPVTRLLIRIMIGGGISGAFYMMGLLRSGQINIASVSLEESTSASIFTYADPGEALLFTLISWLVFLPAVLLTKIAPTKEQWFGIFKAKTLKKLLSDTERKLKEQVKHIAEIQEEIENLKQYEISRNQTARRDEEDALSLVMQIKENYVQSNIRYRLEKSVLPRCFDEELHYPLKTYFFNPKISKK